MKSLSLGPRPMNSDRAEAEVNPLGQFGLLYLLVPCYTHQGLRRQNSGTVVIAIHSFVFSMESR